MVSTLTLSLVMTLSEALVVVTPGATLSPSINFEPTNHYSALRGQQLTSPDKVQALTTFSSFTDLPTEIRLSIWKAATPKGRVIRLDMDWEADYARTLEPMLVPSIFPRLSRISRSRNAYLSTRVRYYPNRLRSGLVQPPSRHTL